MTRIFAAVILVSALSGCVTSDDLYNRSAISQYQVEPAARRPVKPTQAAQAPHRRRIQVSLQQRARGPLVRRAEYPIILGAAF